MTYTDGFSPMVDAVNDLHDQLDALVAKVDGDELALISLLRLTRECRQMLVIVERAFEDAAAKAWPKGAGDRIALADEWIAERRFGKDRTKWQHEQLQSAVVKAALDNAWDTDTGEIVPPNAATWAVRDALVATSNPSWRTTALKALGIAPDEFCEAVKGRVTINVIPAVSDD